MAKAKRADHQSGPEGPSWSPDSTAEDAEVDYSDWDPDDTEERRVLGSDDHAGSPDQTGPPAQNREGQNGAADVNGSPAASVDQHGGQNPGGARKPRSGQTTRGPAKAKADQGTGADESAEADQTTAGDESTEGGQATAGDESTEADQTTAVDESTEGDQNGPDPQADKDVRSGQDEHETADNGQDDQVARGGWQAEYEAGHSAHEAAQLRPAEFGTPIRVDEIALAAKALSDELHSAIQGLSESVESRQFRRELDEAADTIRSIATELETTAGNLIRLMANEGRSCGVTWGVCPEHGLTLMNVGETVTCHVLGCYLEPEGPVERCTHPVAYKVVDAAGPALFACSGHAIACRLHFEGAVITLATDNLELL